MAISVSEPPAGSQDWYAWATAVHNTCTTAVAGTGVTTVRKLTQAQYDALSTKDAGTLYVIVG